MQIGLYIRCLFTGGQGSSDAEYDDTEEPLDRACVRYMMSQEKAVSDKMANNVEDNMLFKQILSLKHWADYFDDLAATVNFELAVYGKDDRELFIANKNPLCEFIRSAELNNISCPGSCIKLLKSGELVIDKCEAMLASFAFTVEGLDEKVVVLGRGCFAECGDLHGFEKILSDNDFSEIQIPSTVSFPGRESIRALAEYVRLTVNRMLKSIEGENSDLEKLLRMTTLFDDRAFSILYEAPELIYRYILDTIEFAFGHTSSFFMIPDESGLIYKTICSRGKQRDVVSDFCLDIENPLVSEMRDTSSAVYYEGLEEMVSLRGLRGIKSVYLFPVMTGGDIEGIIGVLDKAFSPEDLKIMGAFRNYVQLNLENLNLRAAAERNRKADERLNCLKELSTSIVSILDKERLLNTLLIKSLHLLRAEQGSLMLLDRSTSELVVEARKSGDDVVREKMRFKKGESIAGMALGSRGPLLVEDIEKDPRIRQANRPRYRTKSFMSIPIKIENRLAGVLNVSDKIKGGVFNQDDLNMIETFIGNVSIAIERSILYKQKESLRKLSITDPLTGIFNRRYLNKRLSEEITRYERYKHPFSFVMLDLNKFKEYNDTFGHIAGDNLLRVLADIMTKSLRAIDIAARFGGDEFVALFPQTPKVDAIQITTRLKEKIDRALSRHNVEMPLNVSMGLATFPDDAASIIDLVEKTDQALYLAKKGDGNRVVYL